MARVRLERLTKRFGRVVAAREVTLDIKDGEFFSFLGPSGCGKTTTLRMVAGFEPPDEGRVYFDAADVTPVPPEARPVGMVFQNYALFPNMTVFGNVAFPLRLKKLPAETIQKKVGELLALVHLEGLENRYPRELSGGQQQRVALARALAREPDVLLLDEPLSALDAKIREELRGELKRLQRSLGTTSLYVTHDQEEALALSDRIAVMNEGRIEQVGTPTEVYQNPRTLFVARFVGTSSLVEGEARGGVFTRGGRSWGVRVEGEGRGILVLRPEAIRLDPEGPFEAEVRLETYLGPITRVELVFEGVVLKVDVPSSQAPRQGERVRFFLPEAAPFFPASALGEAEFAPLEQTGR